MGGQWCAGETVASHKIHPCLCFSLRGKQQQQQQPPNAAIWLCRRIRALFQLRRHRFLPGRLTKPTLPASSTARGNGRDCKKARRAPSLLFCPSVCYRRALRECLTQPSGHVAPTGCKDYSNKGGKHARPYRSEGKALLVPFKPRPSPSRESRRAPALSGK